MKYHALVTIDESNTIMIVTYSINNGVRVPISKSMVDPNSEFRKSVIMIYNILSQVDTVWVTIDYKLNAYAEFVFDIACVWVKLNKTKTTFCIDRTGFSHIKKFEKMIPNREIFDDFCKQNDISQIKCKIVECLGSNLK